MENRSRGNKPVMQQNPETKHEDSKPLMQVKTSDLSTSSSECSLSPSSSDDSLELGSNPKKDPLRDLSSSPASSSSSPDVPNQTPPWSMISASPRGESFPDFGPEWSGTNPSSMKSPQRQYPPGYDPNRIPSSVFASKAGTTEWSTASNESLFSITMGNSSFSRDQYNMMYKSGEFARLEESNNPPPNPYYAPEAKSVNEKKSLPPNLPPLIEVATDNNEAKSANVVESPTMQGKDVETPKVTPTKNQENNIKETTSSADEVQHPPSTPNKSDGKVFHPFDAIHASSPRLSNESGNSCSSFAFPVLLNDGKNSSLKAASVKMERPPSQSQTDSQPEIQPPSPPPKSTPRSKPESQPKAASTSWFSCCSCWPRCC